MELASSPGKGSAFSFTSTFKLLQREKEVTRAEQTAQQSKDNSEAKSTVVQKLRILLAEDNPVNQKLAVKLLENAGHEVVVAENGEKAVKLHESQSFDVILMDISMPVMDGYEATNEIRIRETIFGSYTPIIALTAHVITGDREKCLAAGMDDYLTKPIDIEELREKLAQIPSKKVQ